MSDFDKDFYLATLRTGRMVGMNIIPQWKCALLMAIVTVWGNNEGFSLSPKFQCDRIYIQETYHIDGGEVMDEEFAEELRTYVAKCEAATSNQDPFYLECEKLIMDRYNFKLLY